MGDVHLRGHQCCGGAGGRGPFHKASYSGQEGDCVEVAHATGGGCAVRDSKNLDGPRLLFAATAWDSFMGVLKADYSAC
ncbi:DUF397 domain-containing protein [Streptomyces nigrescens]